ncbi:hypothetical protein CYMTET_28101 [Cymbomonas tetramitiformis]|uniref:Helicase ATP-binding domain-containing protein n=1 Tax=Cymbomonas tetramitiformis TaxID=36881 RepID=A0AAE0KWJ7_9CHLO|nr:hypothetical protein CYMTET_28101 [Cymbomonas tetramitiformis]
MCVCRCHGGNTIHKEALPYANCVGVALVFIFGGSPIGPQKAELYSKQPDILIATPGRLLDILGNLQESKAAKAAPVRRSLCLQETRLLILDEADKMLSMGFEADVRKIVSRTAQLRQTLFFTATWPQVPP